jgi:phenylalanyl-tRNA synthetase beta chain
MAAVFTDKKAGFEMVHGLLDRIMQILSVPFLQSSESKGEYGYYISQSDGMLSLPHPGRGLMTEPTYLAGRGAKIHFRPRQPTQATEPHSEGPLVTIAESLKAALPGVKTHTDSTAPNGDIVIGSLGILHPSVLGNFELSRPCSALEIDVEPFL